MEKVSEVSRERLGSTLAALGVPVHGGWTSIQDLQLGGHRSRQAR